MKRVFVALVTLILAGMCYAETDYRAMPIIKDIQLGRQNNNAIQDLYVKDDAIIVDDMTVGDDLTVTGDVSVVGQIAPATMTVSGTITGNQLVASTTGYTGARIAGLPKDSFTFFDDFFSIQKATNVTEETVLLAPWKYVGDGGVAADVTIGASAGGILNLTAGSSSNDEAYLQYGSAGTEGMFSFTNGDSKRLVYESYNTAPMYSPTGSVLFVGLAEAGAAAANFIVDTTGELDTNKSFIGFVCDTGYTNKYWHFVVHKADDPTVFKATNVMVNAGAAAYRRLGFTWDGVQTLTATINGTNSTRTFTISSSTATSYPIATAMSPLYAVKTIFATYQPTNLIDYVYGYRDR